MPIIAVRRGRGVINVSGQLVSHNEAINYYGSSYRTMNYVDEIAGETPQEAPAVTNQTIETLDNLLRYGIFPNGEADLFVYRDGEKTAILIILGTTVVAKITPKTVFVSRHAIELYELFTKFAKKHRREFVLEETVQMVGNLSNCTRTNWFVERHPSKKNKKVERDKRYRPRVSRSFEQQYEDYIRILTRTI